MASPWAVISPLSQHLFGNENDQAVWKCNYGCGVQQQEPNSTNEETFGTTATTTDSSPAVVHRVASYPWLYSRPNQWCQISQLHGPHATFILMLRDLLQRFVSAFYHLQSFSNAFYCC